MCIKKKKKERKKIENIYIYEKEKMSMYKNKIKWTPRFSTCIMNFEKASRLKIQTHLSNHVQSDNEDFLCVSEPLFAICTCPPISKCVYFSPLLDITLFSNYLFDESRQDHEKFVLFWQHLIYNISIGLNFSQKAPHKAYHIYMFWEGKGVE
jgi:hypothetical protein